jgi:hypothetical protein
VAHASPHQKERLRSAIERHLAEHPLAADTASGILASWLPARGFEDAREHIDVALQQLVAEGWLRAHILPDGELLFVANPMKCARGGRGSLDG